MFDITEGHNLYEKIDAVVLFIKLAEDLRDGNYGNGGGVGWGGVERVKCLILLRYKEGSEGCGKVIGIQGKEGGG